jgi:hypothetical protein
MQVVDRKSTSYTADTNKMVQHDVSIAISDKGIINLSGIYKAKATVQVVLDTWNTGGIQATIVPNDKGAKKGFKVINSKVPVNTPGHLIGFINMFDPEMGLDEVVPICRNCRTFVIHINVLSDAMASGL